MSAHIPELNIRQIYAAFNQPITLIDCGEMCAPYNSNETPFCCDICHAVPAAYAQEWKFLQKNTYLWHEWRGDECAATPTEAASLRAETPEAMLLLACLGATQCQRPYRALSCRQFPFFPYITDDFRFLGLAYEWAFEDTCWVISHLEQVSLEYRQEFTTTFDELFSRWPQEMESYAIHSEEMRSAYVEMRRRIPILHRNGGCYLLNPGSERIQRVESKKLAKHGPYQ